jgi:hypothetical protein
MAVLSDNDRLATWANLMREFSNLRSSVGITKAELRAALNAVDQWAEDNAAEFNLALPQPARGSLTAKQKALLLMFVIAKRHEVT